MKKTELKTKTEAVVNETQAALQTMYDALNSGQKKKIIKNDEVKILFVRYGVTYQE